MRVRRLVLPALLLATGCSFEPGVTSGSLRCGAGNACPPDLYCSSSGVCCAADDHSRLCAPDGGAASSDPDGGVTAAPVPRRLVDGLVHLIGFAQACTRARASAGSDRWCAFTRESELWAVNVSHALREGVRCDGSDRHCLRVSSTLYSPAVGETVAYPPPQFQGDVLLYPAEGLTPEGNRYRGGVFAWVPGWASGRRITSDNGFACLAAREAPSVACVDRAPGGMFDLQFGPVAFPLPRVKRFSTPDIVVDLSSNGRSLLYEEVPASGPATLWLAPQETAGNPDTHLVIGRDVVSREWGFATHGPQIFFLRANTGTADRLSATLSTTLVRNPAAVADLGARIGSFIPLEGASATDLGVAALQDQTDGVGVLKLFLGVPSREVVIGTTSFRFAVSPDGRFTLFSPVPDPATGRRDARIADHEASSVCALQREARTVLDPLDAFTENGELAFWYEYPEVSRTLPDGWLARSRGCAEPRKFAERILVHYVIRNRGLLYVDEVQSADGGVLKFLKWGPDLDWPASGPLSIQGGVDTPLAVLEPDRRVVVFTSPRAGSEGLYAVELP